jgi:glutaredoxin
VTESADLSPRASAPDGAASARVQLLGRQGCHLCDVAKEVVAGVTAAAGETFVEVDIDDDPALRERYTDLVPVVLVDGVEHAHWRVDPGRLRAALS